MIKDAVTSILEKVEAYIGIHGSIINSDLDIPGKLPAGFAQHGP